MSTEMPEGVTVLSTDAKGWKGDAWHIQIGGKYYIISAVDLGPALFPGQHETETMAFACDSEGNVDSFADLAMVPRKDHLRCINELVSRLGGAS